MEKIYLKKDEQIVLRLGGSKEALIRECFKLVFIIGILTAYSISCPDYTFNSPPEGYTVTGWNILLVTGYALCTGLAITYMNSIVIIKTIDTVLTQDRLIYTHAGFWPVYKEFQLSTINYSVIDDQSTYYNAKNGELTIVMKNEDKEVLKNIQDAFDMDSKITELITERLENENK